MFFIVVCSTYDYEKHRDAPQNCSRVLGVIFSSAVIDIGYVHATLSTAHIRSMSSTKRTVLIDWIMVSNAVVI